MRVKFIPDFKNPLNVYVDAILTKGNGPLIRSGQGKGDGTLRGVNYQC